MFCVIGVLPVAVVAQDRAAIAMPETVLIRNVTLVNQVGEAEDIVVNILLRNRKLDVVTQDKIAADTVELALDAQEGILLGKLDLGEAPNFLILSGDPRDDFKVLLDTATYARFAISDGVIVLNRLRSILDSVEQAKRSGWLAYTPPPLALPISYQDTTKWNRWDTRAISGLFVGAMLVDRQSWRTQDVNSETQVGDLSEFSGGEIRGLRVGVIGTLNFPRPWVYTAFIASNAFDKGFDTDKTDDWKVYDLRLDIPAFAGTTISIGKQKEPISMERLMSLIYLPLQERSVVNDAMLPARNVGVVLSGGAFDQRLTWAGGVFNDWLDTGDSFSAGAVQYIARVTGLPFVSSDQSNLVHLGVGLRFSDANEGLLYASEPEFKQSPNFVGTGFFGANRSVAYNFEASWRKGPFWLLGEYMLNGVDAPDLGSPDFTGFNLTGSWALTGEMRGYNYKSGTFDPLPVSKSVYQGGWGTWEAAARWSDIDLSDGSVDGGDMQILSLGLNWWLSPIFSVNLNYRWVTLDRFGIEGDSSGLLGRVVLLLE